MSSSKKILKCKDKNMFKIKVYKKIYQDNNQSNKTGTAIVISDKINFRGKIMWDF